MGSSFIWRLVFSVLIGSVFVPAVGAESGQAGNSPVGRWRTVDDVTGKAKSVVAIWEENGKLYGRVQKLLDPDPKDPNPTCDDCAGDQKGQPVIGLKILWDLQKDGDGWSGGTILDPANGKTYKCLLLRAGAHAVLATRMNRPSAEISRREGEQSAHRLLFRWSAVSRGCAT
jgi:uncharacterized protein (DUF2147 family)